MTYDTIQILTKINDRVEVWSAHRDEIVAFNDPSLWVDTSDYDKYFQLQEDKEWGLTYNGIIIVDFDKKRIYSLSDTVSASKLNIPLDPSQKDKFISVGLKSLSNLLKSKSSCNDAFFELSQVHARSKDNNGYSNMKIELRTLSEIMPSDLYNKNLTLSDIKDMFQEKQGNLSIGGCDYLIYESYFLPQGWNQITNEGMQYPKDLISILMELRSNNFPPPKWDSFDDKLDQYNLPHTKKSILEFFKNIERDIESGESVSDFFNSGIYAHISNSDFLKEQTLEDECYTYIALKEKWLAQKSHFEKQAELEEDLFR